MADDPRKPDWRDAIFHEHRLLALLAVGLLAALLLLAAGLGNIVLVILAFGLLVLLERTVGDWLVDFVGSGGRSVVVGLVLLVIGWQFLSSAPRRAATVRFLGLDAYWDDVEIPGGGFAVPASSTGLPPPGAVRPTPSPASPNAPPPRVDSTPAAPSSRVSMAVGSRSDQEGVRLEARLTGAEKIDGIVDFIVDGRRVASTSVAADGTAIVRVPNLGPGTHRVEARFRGRRDLGQTSATTTVRR